MLKFILLWLPMPVIAIINAVLRETLFAKSFSQKAAHQLSTVTILIFLGIYIYIILNRWRLENFSQAVWTGVIWCMLTIIFEFTLGFAAKKSLSEIIKAYDILNGELWVLVPIFLLSAPALFYYFLSK
jgi:hypothetical protein